MQEKECKHNYIGTYPSMKAECTLCGKKFEEPKEGTEKWEDKDSWCVSFVADCLIAGGEKGITRDLSYLTEELRKRINEIVLSEKAESFREGQMSGGLNAFPICLEEIEEAKKQARKEVLEELNEELELMITAKEMLPPLRFDDGNRELGVAYLQEIAKNKTILEIIQLLSHLADGKEVYSNQKEPTSTPIVEECCERCICCTQKEHSDSISSCCSGTCKCHTSNKKI